MKIYQRLEFADIVAYCRLFHCRKFMFATINFGDKNSLGRKRLETVAFRDGSRGGTLLTCCYQMSSVSKLNILNGKSMALFRANFVALQKLKIVCHGRK